MKKSQTKLYDVRLYAWLVVVLISMVLLAACGTSEPTPTATSPAPPAPTNTVPPEPAPTVDLNGLYNVYWILVAMGDKANPTIVEEGTIVSAIFSPDGSLSGSGGCNNYSASYQATEAGSLMVNSPMAVTMMACEQGMDQESRYLGALQSAQTFSFSEEGRLRVAYDSGAAEEEVLVYAKGQVSLTDTQWVLLSYGDPTNPTPVEPGIPVTALFSTDGMLSGSAGCNNYTAGYTASNGQMTVSAIGSTMMMCPTGMEQESAYLVALGSAQSYQIVGPNLQISYNNGQGMLTYTSANLALENVLWTLVTMDGSAIPADVLVTAIFNPAESGEGGTVTGSAGCNSYNAEYQADDTNLTVGMPATTRMFCETAMDIETAYLAGLQSASQYQILGNTLQITTGTGQLVYQANRAPLEGTQWELVSMGELDNPQAVIDGSVITAQFLRNPGTPSGILAGNSGCNEYNSTYAASLTELKVNTPVTTRMACPEELMSQEQNYLTNLTSAKSYAILGNNLYIYYGDGKFVLVYTVSEPPAEETLDLMPLKDTTWYLFSINGQPTVPGTLISAIISVSEDGKFGSATGSAGCNQYQATFGGGAGVATTLTSNLVCAMPAGVMEQEQRYLAAFNAATGYWLSGDQLIVDTAQGPLTFGKQVPASSRNQAYLLQGVNWYLTAYNNTEVGPAVEPAFVVFAAGGTISGFTGCNTISGNYTTNIEQITTSNVSTGSNSCSNDTLNQQQTAMVDNLRTARTYQIANNVLQIAADSGVLIFSSVKPAEPTPPVADVKAPATAAVGEVVTFDGSISTSSTPITSYLWDFGDGTGGEGAVIQHVFVAAGDYNVKLTVTNSAQLSSEGFQKITITPPAQTPPTAVINGPASAYPGEPVSFSAAGSTPGSSNIASYTWDFGDGYVVGPVAESEIQYLFGYAGVYQVSVIVTDQNGLSSSASMQVTVNARLDTTVWTKQPVLPGTAITLQFMNGQFTGFAGCNTYNGTYSAVNVQPSIYNVTITSLSSTQMSCPAEIMQQEQEYLAAIQTVTVASVQGDYLQLTYAGGEMAFYAFGSATPR